VFFGTPTKPRNATAPYPPFFRRRVDTTPDKAREPETTFGKALASHSRSLVARI
jgi:hypothetical protein